MKESQKCIIKKNKDIKQFFYGDYTFHFKYETNPNTGNYEPHITVRRNLTVEDAINTFFSISKETYNEQNARWEAYSSSTKLELFYTHINNIDKLILIISLFKPEKGGFYGRK